MTTSTRTESGRCVWLCTETVRLCILIPTVLLFAYYTYSSMKYRIRYPLIKAHLFYFISEFGLPFSSPAFPVLQCNKVSRNPVLYFMYRLVNNFSRIFHQRCGKLQSWSWQCRTCSGCLGLYILVMFPTVFPLFRSCIFSWLLCTEVARNSDRVPEGVELGLAVGYVKAARWALCT